MAQQLIDLGTTANDRTGDTWRAGGTKINENFTELFTRLDAITIQFISQESDFTVQDATTITLEASTVYITTDAFSTDKQFVPESGAAITSLNQFGPVMTYTGTLAMFDITDANFTIQDIQIDAPNASQVYSFVDTTGAVFAFVHKSVSVVSCNKMGTINNAISFTSRSSQCLDCGDGFSIVGSGIILVSIVELGLISSSGGFKGVDYGTSVPQLIENRDISCIAPPGAFGISGLANNGNVPTGSIAEVTGCTFQGGMTDLENITNKDIRWQFTNNFPTSDTMHDYLISLVANVTETVISASSTPVKIAGTWTIENSSLFTTDTTGRATYIGERDITIPVDINITASSASGTNKSIKQYIALNGTVITNSGKANKVGVTDPRNTTLIWQQTLSTNDFIEGFMENNSDTINLIADDATSRGA